MLSPGEFTPEYVVTALEQAGKTLLSMEIKGARPAGFRSNMPEPVRTYHESYGVTAERGRAPLPSHRQISEMERALGWISLIPSDRAVVRRIVHCRSLIAPLTERHVFSWRRVAQYLHCDFRAAQRWHAEGIATIVCRLNQPGLCALAGGRVGPSPEAVRNALDRIKAAEPARRKPVRALEFV